MEDKYAVFDQYISGDLDGEALMVFQRQLEGDALLQKELAIYRKGLNFVLWQDSPEKEALIGQIKTFEKKYFSEDTIASTLQESKKLDKERKDSGRFVKLALLVVVTLALLIGLFFIFRPKKQPPKDIRIIAASEFYPLPVPSTLGPNSTDSLSAAFFAYSTKQFDKAILIFGAIPKSNDRYAEAQLFSGYAFFELNKYADAAAAFENVINSNDLRYKANAEWNQLLTLVVLGEDKAKITSCFKRIVENPNHNYYQAALLLFDEWNQQNQ